MDGNIDYKVLVEKARLGDEDSMNRLMSLGEESLRRYVFRMTLNEAVTDDIVQEVLLEMFKVLGNLKRADRFRAWLHGIAFNRIRRYYGDKWEGKKKGMPDDGHAGISVAGSEGLANLVNEELKQIIFGAINHLEPRQRAVLTMRCYDEMSYSEIAETMQCSELNVRALFYRAKRSLARQLSRRGLGKGLLLTALVLFGKMTAVSEAGAAEVCVTAGTIKVGLGGSVVGAMTGKAAVTSLAAAGVITAGALIAVSSGGGSAQPVQEQTGNSTPAIVQTTETSEDAQERWYYYPEGSGGAVMTRSVLPDHDGGERLCQWLQNDTGNYHYDHHRNAIYLKNYRVWAKDFSVGRLPTDSAELNDFISEVEGKYVLMDNVRSQSKNLLVIARTEKGASGSTSWTMRHKNVLEEDYFRCDWPAGAQVVDQRDEMHKRGWTYMRIEGQLGGRPVSGTGRFAFVYGTWSAVDTWLTLRVGEFEIAGDTRGYCVRNAEGKVIETYSGAKEAGVFAGLSRPWAGLHTIDTVRRDAAMKKLRFETRRGEEQDKALVALSCEGLRLDYTIDMERDVIERIVFVSEQEAREVGDLRFSYVGDFDETVDIGRRDVLVGPESKESRGILWLVGLATGKISL